MRGLEVYNLSSIQDDFLLAKEVPEKRNEWFLIVVDVLGADVKVL